jgi:topoisomerase IA-like protein
VRLNLSFKSNAICFHQQQSYHSINVHRRTYSMNPAVFERSANLRRGSRVVSNDTESPLDVVHSGKHNANAAVATAATTAATTTTATAATIAAAAAAAATITAAAQPQFIFAMESRIQHT